MLKPAYIALALGTFALGIAEFAMMAILSNIAAGLNITIPEAGSFISAYSMGVALGSMALAFMNALPLKKILLALCLIIVFGNLGAAMAPDAQSLYWARLVSGLPHGAYFGVAAVVATRLAGYGEKASAVAIMISGMTVANVAGVPLATLVVNLLTWRMMFLIVTLGGILAFLGIWRFIPPMAPNSRGKCATFKCQFLFLKKAAPWLIYAGTFFGQAALYCWYSYIEPSMLHVAGFSEDSMSWIMALAGVGMFTGGLVAGKIADRFPPGLVTSLICFAMLPTLFCIWLYDASKPLSLLLAFIGAAEIFALGGPLQFLIVQYSKGGELLGGAGIQVAFNVANAFAAWLGGMCIAKGFGYSSPAIAGLPLALIGAIALLLFHFMYCKKIDRNQT